MSDTQIDQPESSELHPSRWAGLAPLFTWRGLDVYPVFGAEGDEDGGDDANSDSDDSDEDATGDGEDEEGSGAVTREEFDKLRKQLSASDKNRAAAEKKLKEIEDGKKDELTKATERAEELEKQNGQLNKDLAEARLQNAFLSANTGITWHDPADALALAERQGYLAEVVGEDGKVDSGKLAAKLKELAKAKPHLVKTSDGESGKSKKDEAPKTPTGAPVGSKGSGTNGKKDDVPARYGKHFI